MPHFTIEAQGETNPLSRQTILITLANASGGSATPQALKVATQQIANWEKTPGYHALLQDVYADFTLNQEVRFQAIIQLKNGIDKHWRKTSTNAISKAEKDQIKTRAIESGIREPESALALQNALMLAKIVRYEFPHDWPDVIGTITRHLRTASENLEQVLYISNILVIALQIIKELSSGRLQRTKKSLEHVAPELLHVLGGLYLALVDLWQDQSVRFDAAAAGNSNSALKTLRRLLVVGFEHPHRENDVAQFWSTLQRQRDGFWLLYMQQISEPHRGMAMKHLLQLSKLYLEMARNHPASFVLLDSMQILNNSWNTINEAELNSAAQNAEWKLAAAGDQDDDSPMEKLALKALLLFRACVKMVFNPVQTFKYQTPQDKEDRRAAVDQIKGQVLTDDFVVRVMELLVTKFFVLRPSDLRDWEQDPDEWERREEEIVDAWEFSIRSCSEKLFLDLVINFKELLVPRLLQVFHQYATTSNTDVLLKDSLYSAVGIAAACLEDVLDFNTFLRTTLVAEVQIIHPSYNLLRRRIAILLGQWVPIKPETLDRVAVYQIFTHLLSKEEALNDHVVRVTAGRQLRLVLEPFEFNYEDIAPYATSILQNLLLLISETDLSETKMALLETVRVAVTKLEGNIEPYASGIMSTLPPLWDDSGEEHLMKQAILTMITAIVNSLGTKSLAYHEAIIPLIHDSVQPESEAIVYLLEEALDLWAAILQQTSSKDPEPSTQLLALSTSLLPLLEMGSEALRQTFELIESYAILSPNTLLATEFLSPFLNSMKSLLPTLSSSRSRDASLAPHVLENLVATLTVPVHFAPDAQQQAIKHLLTSMVDTSYLKEVLVILHEAYDYHQDPRPNRKPPDVVGPAETSLFSLLSRLILVSPDLFVEAVSATGNSIDWIVIEWIAHFDAIGDILRKKLQTLAITNLLLASSPPPTILLEQLQSLMTIWTDVVLELGQESAEESQGDYLWHNKPSTDVPDWPDATPEDGRKRQVSNQDPIYNINVRVFIADRLRQVMAACGGAVQFEQEWLSRTDSAVLKSFVDLRLMS